MSQHEGADIRINHISISAQQMMAFDSNEWEETIQKDENRTLIKDFLDTSTTNILLIYFDTTEKLVFSSDIKSILGNSNFPLPKRLCFFLKNCKTVSVDNYKRDISFGNLSDFPFDQYQSLFKKVFVPIFCNPSNSQRWPIEIAHDINSHIKDFQTDLSYHVGLTEQKTVLMIPDTAKLIENYDQDQISKWDCQNQDFQNIMHSITEMLSNWIPIVQEVLELTTEQVILQVDQDPTTEISFWNDRKEQLEFIYSQVDSPIVKKMVFALEKTNNTHLPNFKILLQDIAEGLDEAREVCKSLNAISTYLEDITNCSFPSLQDLLPKVMKKITSSWMQSKYYKSIPSQIIVLLKKICYTLFKKTHKFLDPLSLFTVNRDKAIKDVKISIDIMSVFLKSYDDCREYFHSDDETEVYPWKFPDKRVFTQFELLVQRLKEILDIISAAETYYNIPVNKLFKMQQAEYRKRLENIQSQFTKEFEVFEKCAYDPLDLNSIAFPEDYISFLNKVKELDIQIGITIGQVSCLCKSFEEASQIMNTFADIIERPFANKEFQKLASSPILNVSKEFLNVQDNYDSLAHHIEHSDELIVYNNLPHISGVVQWTLDQQNKLSFPMKTLEEVSENIEIEEKESVVAKYKKIYDHPKEFEKYLGEKCKIRIASAHSKLDQEVLKKGNGSEIFVNFHSQISEVFQDVHYLKRIKKDNILPEDAKQFIEISETVLLSHSLLTCSVQWFNELNESLLEAERKLISKDWKNIQVLIRNGLNKKWKNNDLLTYAKELYNAIKPLHEKVIQSRQNVSKVQEFIKMWSSKPMFVRENPDLVVDFEIDMTPQMQDTISALKQTREDMKELLEENQELFKNEATFEDWECYESYLDTLIENAIKDVIKCSLEYIQSNLEVSNTKSPFYEVCMWLDEDVMFSPPLQHDEPESLWQLFLHILDNIFSLSTVIKRLKKDNVDYYEVISNCKELKAMKNYVEEKVLEGCNEALSASEIFTLYSDLWLRNVEEELDDFVQHGPVQDVPTENEEGIVLDDQPESRPPTEDDFKFQISQFDKLSRKVEGLPQEIKVSWLLLNVSSFKERLLTIIRKWSSAYKKKLVELKSLGKLRKLEEDE